MKKRRILLLFASLLFCLNALADILDSYDSKHREILEQDHSIRDNSLKNEKLKTKPSETKKKKVTKDKKNNTKEGGKRAPVKFEGMSLKGFKSEGLVELHEKVVVTQDDLKLISDEAKIFLEEESDDVKKIIAKGRVEITKKDETTGKNIKANSDIAEFDNLTQIITLRGNARVVKGEDVLHGNLIHYNVTTGWIDVEKVKGVVSP